MLKYLKKFEEEPRWEDSSCENNPLLGGRKFFRLTSGILVFAIVAGYLFTNTGDVSRAAVGINKSINFQGKLTDSSSVTVADGTQSIVFRIYDSSTSGTCLYSARGTCGAATAKSITVTNGIFSTLIGESGDNDLSAVDFNSDSLFLGVKVGSDDEMTPRIRVGSAAYAFNADQIDGLDSGSFLRSDTADTAHGLITFNATPIGTAVNVGSLYVNATTTTANLTLFGAAANGSERFRVDMEGDVFASSTIFAGAINTATTTATSTFSGAVAAVGNLRLGDASSDLIQVDGRFTTSLLPAVNNAVDLGSFGNSWKDIYASGTLRNYGHTVLGNRGQLDAFDMLFAGLTTRSVLNIQEEHTDLSQDFGQGITNHHMLAPSGSVGSEFDGLNTEVSTSGTIFKNYGIITGHISEVTHSGGGTVGSLYGTHTNVFNSSTNTVTNAFGLSSAVINTNTGTIGNLYGVYIDRATNNGGGTISNAYGLYIRHHQSEANTTNAYNIYSEGEESKIFIDGPIGVATTTPQAKLHIRNTSKDKALVLQAASSTQSANIFEYWNNVGPPNGTLLSWIGANGGLGASGTSQLAHIVSAANNAFDLGSATSSWRDFYASGTSRFGNRLLPNTNNSIDLGSFANAWKDFYASGTVRGGVVLADGGTVSAPGFAWDGDSDTGMYRNAANSFSITTNGVQRVQIDTGAVYIIDSFPLVSLTNNGSDLGVFGRAWNDVFASGTLRIGGTNQTITIDPANVVGPLITSAGALNLTSINDINITPTGIVALSTTGSSDTPLVVTGRIRSTDGLNASGTTYLSHTVPGIHNAYDLGSPTSSWRNVYASGTLIFAGSGTSTISGNLEVLGNTRLGDATGDLIQVTGRFSTSLLPNINNSLDLGAYANAWKDFYASGTVRASATLVGVGTAGAPAYSFDGDTNTGIFSPAADQIRIVVGGGTNNALNIDVNQMLSTQAGTEALPFLARSGDPNTGFYYDTDDSIAITANGNRRFNISDSGNISTFFDASNVPLAWVNASGGIGASSTILVTSPSTNPGIDFSATGTFRATTTDSLPHSAFIFRTDGVGSTADLLRVFASNTERFSISATGTVSASGTLFMTGTNGTNTFSGGIRAGGLNSSNGLSVTSGQSILGAWEDPVRDGFQLGLFSAGDSEFIMRNTFGDVEMLVSVGTNSAIVGTASNHPLGLFTGLTNRVTIDTNGHMKATLNNTYDLGTFANAWKDFYASGTARASATLVGLGTAGAPTYSFDGDTDTGIYSTADVLRFTTGGSQRLLISSDGTIATVGSVPIVSFTNNGSDLGAKDQAFKSIYASGTVYFGHTVPAGNNIYDLGSPTSSWRNVYASGTINSSGVITSNSGTSTFANLQVNGNASGTRFIAAAGSAANPSFTFSDDTDTGLYRNTANSFSITTNGTQRVQIDTGAMYLIDSLPLVSLTNNGSDLGVFDRAWNDVFASGTAYISGTVNIGTDGVGEPNVVFAASGTFSASGGGTPITGSAFEFDTRGVTGGSAGLLTVRENGVLVMQVRNDDRWLFYSGGTLRGIFGYESSDDTMRIEGGTSESIGIVSNQGDGSTALGAKIYNTTELDDVGAKLVSIQNSSQLGSEEAFIGAGASNPRIVSLARTGQTANLFEARNAAVGATSTVAWINASGGIGASSTVYITSLPTAFGIEFSSTGTFRASTTDSGAAGSAVYVFDTDALYSNARLISIREKNNERSYFDSAGGLFTPSSTITGTLSLVGGSGTEKPLIIQRSSAGYTGNIIEYYDTADTANNFWVNASGGIGASSTINITTPPVTSSLPTIAFSASGTFLAASGLSDVSPNTALTAFTFQTENALTRADSRFMKFLDGTSEVAYFDSTGGLFTGSSTINGAGGFNLNSTASSTLNGLIVTPEGNLTLTIGRPLTFRDVSLGGTFTQPIMVLHDGSSFSRGISMGTSTLTEGQLNIEPTATGRQGIYITAIPGQVDSLFVVASSSPGSSASGFARQAFEVFATGSIYVGRNIQGDAGTVTSTFGGSVEIDDLFLVDEVFHLNTLGSGTSTIGGNLHLDDTGSSDGNLRVEGNVQITGTCSSEGATNTCVDVAEIYPSSEPVDAGELVVLDLNGNLPTVKKSDSAYSEILIGVVSGFPGLVVGNNGISIGTGGGEALKPAIALVGRVPVKVTTENGEIQPGDFLTSSSQPGIAMRATRAGTVIGRALETYTGEGDEDGKILVFVNTSWYGGIALSEVEGSNGNPMNQASETSLSGSVTLSELNMEGDINMNGHLIKNIGGLVALGETWKVDADGNFVTKGTFATEVETEDGKSKKFYALGSPDVEFHISGSGQMSNGEALIEFESETSASISPEIPLKVTVTLTDNANGVFVTEKTTNGFKVKELANGTSNATFDWVVIARRKGYEVLGENAGLAQSATSTGDSSNSQLLTSDSQSIDGGGGTPIVNIDGGSTGSPPVDGGAQTSNSELPTSETGGLGDLIDSGSSTPDGSDELVVSGDEPPPEEGGSASSTDPGG